MKNTTKVMIDDEKIIEAKNHIDSLIGKHVFFYVKEVHKTNPILYEGTVKQTFDNLFIINQKINKYYSEDKSFTYRDYLTGRIYFK